MYKLSRLPTKAKGKKTESERRIRRSRKQSNQENHVRKSKMNSSDPLAVVPAAANVVDGGGEAIGVSLIIYIELR